MDTKSVTNNASAQKRLVPPALNPELPGLVQPWKDYVQKGLVCLKVNFTPMGVLLEVQPGPKIRENGESDSTIISIGEAKARIEAAGLVTTRKGANKKGGPAIQPPPMKSLIAKDFEGSDEILRQRIKSVGSLIGPDVARARIITHKLNPTGVDDFEKWWEASGERERVLLLADQKHIKTIKDTDLKKLKTLEYPCPFRGSLLPASKPAAEKADKDGKGKGKAGTSVAGITSGPRTPPAQIIKAGTPPAKQAASP